MSWAPSFLVDGQTPGVSTVNTIFTAASTYVNALDRYALRRGALNVHQTPSVIATQGASFPVSASHSGLGVHTYDKATAAGTITYTAFGTDGATDRHLIGGPTAGSPITPSAAAQVSITPTQFVGNNGTDQTQLILVMFDLEVVDVTNSATAASVMACLQFQLDGAGTWYTMSKTERWSSRDDHKSSPTDSNEKMWYPIAIRTMIRASTVNAVADATANQVSGIRAMVSSSSAAGAIIELGSYRLSAIPLLSSLV